MNYYFSFIFILILFSCNSKEEKKSTSKPSTQKNNTCNYINEFLCCGNTDMNLIPLKKNWIDPIDDTISFVKSKYFFYTKDNKVYRKSKTFRSCQDKLIEVEYFQDLSHKINIESYKELKDPFFISSEKFYFWWTNSSGHLIFPVKDADAETFKPFDNICGGTDEKSIYYGCPNFGVYKLNIPRKSNFKFIAKEKNYWNSPKHYVIIDDKVYDVIFELKKGYHCLINNEVKIKDILNEN